jgi:predicted Co/Zn/Cd cation transporter (cation efflux family)
MRLLPEILFSAAMVLVGLVTGILVEATMLVFAVVFAVVCVYLVRLALRRGGGYERSRVLRRSSIRPPAA